MSALDHIIPDVLTELMKADAKYAHDPMIHMRVGLKTIEAEFVELEREVERFTHGAGNPELLRKEAVQVAAMAVKFLRDIVSPLTNAVK